jgi:hypothetical protein
MDTNQTTTDTTFGNMAQRPALLANLTTSQLDELALQVDEGDIAEFHRIGQSYGWNPEQQAAVYQWLKGTGPTRGGFPGEGR